MRKIVYVAIIALLAFFIYSHSADILGIDDSYSYVNDSGGYDNVSEYYPNVSESRGMDEIPVETESDSADGSDSYSPSSSYSGGDESNTYESEPVTRGSYVASANSDKFHTPYCGNAERIKQANRIYFSSRQEALNSGYSPCKNCNP